MKIKVLGVDGSMSNFGMARCEIDTETFAIEVLDLTLAQVLSETSKTVVKTADNYRRACDIRAAFLACCADVALVMAEIPLMITPHPKMPPGAASLANHNSGLVIGVLAGSPVPLIPVMPDDVKIAALNARRASKEEMIEWAMAKYPNAPWRMRKLHGKMVPVADNEHLADAVAVVHAGVRTAQFMQSIAVFNSMKTLASA
jgi:hypothetical protein